jgi:glutaminyl-tRNA synthetase
VRRAPDRARLAYVDSQSADEIRANRGTLTEPGRNSPYRNRTPEKISISSVRCVKAASRTALTYCARRSTWPRPTSTCAIRALPHQARRAPPHRRGLADLPDVHLRHPIEDAVERVTHSLCTLEFEDQRPFYDWLLERLAEGGLLARPLPQQIEFARLNLTNVVLSKRKLIQLVEERHVSGWDDPRMPTLAGADAAATPPRASAASPRGSASRRRTS